MVKYGKWGKYNVSYASDFVVSVLGFGVSASLFKGMLFLFVVGVFPFLFPIL